MAVTSGVYTLDLRGSLYGNVTSTSLSYFVEFFNGPGAGPSLVQIYATIRNEVFVPMTSVLSRSWQASRCRVVQAHQRNQPFSLFTADASDLVGQWAADAYPPVWATRFAYFGVRTSLTRWSRRSVWLPGTPRFTLFPNGTWSDVDYVRACSALARLLGRNAQYELSPGITLIMRPCVIVRKQPAGTPPQSVDVAQIDTVELAAKIGRIIRRTPGRGI